MVKTPKKLTFLICLVFSILIVGSCSDSKTPETQRKRREDQTTTTKPLQTLPPQTTLPSTTQILTTKPILSPELIKATWTKETLCALIKPQKAKEILDSTALPEGKYSFSNNSGARCSYSNRDGDEIYIEISINSYARSRAIDAALSLTPTNINVQNVTGVAYTNKSTGSIYHLNMWGTDSNQWSVFAPESKQARQMANIIVSDLV